MNHLPRESIEGLEAMIDRHSVTQVLHAIAGICDGKAEHVAMNWRDGALSRHWSDLAHIVDKASDRTAKKEKVPA